MLINRIENAINVVCEQVKSRQNQINWNIASEDLLLYELVACILGSQVQYEHALAAVNYLKTMGLLDINHLLETQIDLELQIKEALEQPIFPPLTKFGGRKYRYPAMRANHIRRTMEAIYLKRNSIKGILESSIDEYDARLRFMSIAIGIGPKQASLFLRNIGYTDNLAILDTHVLRYMSMVGLLPQKINSVSSVQKYEQIENKLFRYTKKFKEKLSCIDTAIWIVMRMCQREKLYEYC